MGDVSVQAEHIDAPVEGPAEAEFERLPAPDESVFRMRQAVLNGDHWFEALLDAVARWRLPQETIGDREYRYLLLGEAFDWLLLAERLLDEMPDLVPPRERDALLFENRWPVEMDDEEFALRMGQAKHSAHLNYMYGVIVEEALQLSVEEEVHKEHRTQVWLNGSAVDEIMYERVYGKTRQDLFALHYEETGIMLRREISFAQWRSFTYWLFKQRLRRQDKARVASDTRKGLAQLTRMELAVSERRHGATLTEADFARRYSA